MKELKFECGLSTAEGPRIEVQTEYGLLDLHNFAEVTSFSYDTSGQVHFGFGPVPGGGLELDGQPVTKVDWQFFGVDGLEVSGRDPEMPLSEEKTMMHFEVKPLKQDWAGFDFAIVLGSDRQISFRATHSEILVSFNERRGD